MTRNYGRRFSSTFKYLKILQYIINMSHAYYDTQLWEAILKYVRISLLQYIINKSHAYYDTQLWEAILKYVQISLLQYI